MTSIALLLHGEELLPVAIVVALLEIAGVVAVGFWVIRLIRRKVGRKS